MGEYTAVLTPDRPILRDVTKENGNIHKDSRT